MTDLEKLKSWFRAQVGVTETGKNNVVYNTFYYGRDVDGDAFPWCCAFIWCGFNQTGLSKLFCDGAKTAYCPYVASWAKKHGEWVTGPYKPGDILLYDLDGDGVADHIGFCTSYVGAFATAIEGNVMDKVAEVQRYNSVIMGALRPPYNSETEVEKGDEDSLPLLKRGDVSGAVLSVQVLLIHKWAVSCGPCGADGEFGPDTERAVKEFQRDHGLDQDGEVGPATWAALIR